MTDIVDELLQQIKKQSICISQLKEELYQSNIDLSQQQEAELIYKQSVNALKSNHIQKKQELVSKIQSLESNLSLKAEMISNFELKTEQLSQEIYRLHDQEKLYRENMEKVFREQGESIKQFAEAQQTNVQQAKGEKLLDRFQYVLSEISTFHKDTQTAFDGTDEGIQVSPIVVLCSEFETQTDEEAIYQVVEQLSTNVVSELQLLIDSFPKSVDQISKRVKNLEWQVEKASLAFAKYQTEKSAAIQQLKIDLCASQENVAALSLEVEDQTGRNERNEVFIASLLQQLNAVSGFHSQCSEELQDAILSKVEQLGQRYDALEAIVQTIYQERASTYFNAFTQTSDNMDTYNQQLDLLEEKVRIAEQRAEVVELYQRQLVKYEHQIDGLQEQLRSQASEHLIRFEDCKQEALLNQGQRQELLFRIADLQAKLQYACPQAIDEVDQDSQLLISQLACIELNRFVVAEQQTDEEVALDRDEELAALKSQIKNLFDAQGQFTHDRELILTMLETEKAHCAELKALHQECISAFEQKVKILSEKQDEDTISNLLEQKSQLERTLQDAFGKLRIYEENEKLRRSRMTRMEKQK